MKRLLIIGSTIFTISAMSAFAGQSQKMNNNAGEFAYTSKQTVQSYDTVPGHQKDTTGKKKPGKDTTGHEIKLKS